MMPAAEYGVEDWDAEATAGWGSAGGVLGGGKAEEEGDEGMERLVYAPGIGFCLPLPEQSEPQPV